MSYRRLDPDKIVTTLERLGRRIAERFPEASLSRVCVELTAAARESRTRAADLARPNLWLRIACGVLWALLGVVGLVVGGRLVAGIDPNGRDALAGLVQVADSALSVTLVLGGGLVILTRLEERLKREAALGVLHELRSIIHVIDMHQLTKDPSAILAGGPRTANSPERRMTPFELTRYLDYCAELLSLAAKVAAVHAQESRDAVVIDAASDLAQLAANQNLKIWQKIAMVQTVAGEEAGTAPRR